MRYDARARVNGLLRLNEGLLRIGLVIKRNQLEFFPARAAFRIQIVDHELILLEPHFADRGTRPRKRIDIGDLDRIFGCCGYCGDEGRKAGGAKLQIQTALFHLVSSIRRFLASIAGRRRPLMPVSGQDYRGLCKEFQAELSTTFA